MKKNRNNRNKKTNNKSSSQTIDGILSMTSAGFGFVTPSTGGEDIFIPAKYIGPAIDGDLVRISFLKKEKRFNSRFSAPAAQIEKILERKRQSIIGELVAGHRLRPLSKSLPEFINIKGSLDSALKGNWIEIRLDSENHKKNKNIHGTLENVFGKVGEIHADLKAIAEEFKLEKPYSADEEERASNLNPFECPRKDFTKLFTMTIDPADAKDFDDAISVFDSNEGTVLAVHIADIAAYISPDSEFDKKAFTRSFTSYLPGMTLPMLPKTFTKRASLNCGVPSLCSTVLITIDNKTGSVIKSERCHGILKVNERLTFDEVQNFIDQKNHFHHKNELRHNLQKIVNLTRLMRKFREKEEHFLKIETISVRAVFDQEENQITSLRVEKQREAEQLVEECMLAANVEVAKELSLKGIPGIYRVHDEPMFEKLAEFADFMKNAFGISTGDLSSRKACNHFFDKIPDDHRKPVIMDAFLRSLPRAFYQSTPGIHFGLGKGHYLHFTSPIRRYPDLFVHQQLWNYDLNKEFRSWQNATKTAESCSLKEQNNDSAYFAANDRMKLHYLRKVILGQESTAYYEAIIQKISSNGMIVNVPELSMNGFVPLENLGMGFRKRAGRLSAKSGHKTYKCGDFIYLRIEKIDITRASAIFRPV